MLSVVLPTYEERESLPIVLSSLQQVLRGSPHEIIVVDDDSRDHTWEVAHTLSLDDPSIRVIRRVGRRGLSSAVVEGFLAAKGDVLLVMDADGQHGPVLVTLLHRTVQEGADVAVGSRYAQGSDTGVFRGTRFALSQVATRLALMTAGAQTSDPMSGFFAVRREVFLAVLPRLAPRGFKILFDILVHLPPQSRVVDIPFAFQKRIAGESKLTPFVALQFLEAVYEIALGWLVPLSFVKYCLVGSLGVIVHLSAYLVFSSVLAGASALTVRSFSTAQVLATEVAILVNFLLNNAWTFRTDRLRGWRLLLGFLQYNVACAFGALANASVSVFLFLRGWSGIASALLGAVVSTVWNYTMSRATTWRRG